MRWEGRRGSENVHDVRGQGGGGGRMAMGGGLGLVVLVVFVLLGGDPRMLTDVVQDPGTGSGGYTQTEYSAPGAQGAPDELKDFVSVVLADTEDVWNELFAQMGRDYPEPKLVLFSGQVHSACGLAGSATGPFYCPADEQVYIDLSFYETLRNRIGAPGDFAQAYVIAHEVGHHVQRQLGITDKMEAMRGRVSQKEYNQLSVRLELQADFFAGVWAHHAQRKFQILEEGDIEEALTAASAIGDDNLQRQQQGHVVPDSFTHGSSAQRVRWFTKGFKTGDLSQGDTFSAREL